jgi:hypothetical protein
MSSVNAAVLVSDSRSSLIECSSKISLNNTILLLALSIFKEQHDGNQQAYCAAYRQSDDECLADNEICRTRGASDYADYAGHEKYGQHRESKKFPKYIPKTFHINTPIFYVLASYRFWNRLILYKNSRKSGHGSPKFLCGCRENAGCAQ